jgi:hypothetical protein
MYRYRIIARCSYAVVKSMSPHTSQRIEQKWTNVINKTYTDKPIMT